MDLRAKLGRLRAQHPGAPPPAADSAAPRLERTYELDEPPAESLRGLRPRIGAHFFAAAAAHEEDALAHLSHLRESRDEDSERYGHGLRGDPRARLRARLAQLVELPAVGAGPEDQRGTERRADRTIVYAARDEFANLDGSPAKLARPVECYAVELAPEGENASERTIDRAGLDQLLGAVTLRSDPQRGPGVPGEVPRAGCDETERGAAPLLEHAGAEPHALAEAEPAALEQDAAPGASIFIAAARARFEGARAQRIAQLRALIEEVNARHVRPDGRVARELGEQGATEQRSGEPVRQGAGERAASRRAGSDEVGRSRNDGRRAEQPVHERAAPSEPGREGGPAFGERSVEPAARSARLLTAALRRRQLRALREAVTGSALLRAEDLSLPDRLGAPQRAAPPWACMPTAHGTLHYVERWLEPDHHHGRAPVRDGLRMSAATLAVLTRDAAIAELDLSGALFLDTETTGLAGGAGTVAFLIGLARFEDGVLCVEQLLVPELGREAPVLARLAERLAAASCMVTYNGKSFDWPLLRNRFVLARMPLPPMPAHVDLLHATRRIWKGRIAGLRLSDVERQILHFERAHDIGGEEIPARYFEYLRGGEAARLAPVLEHNQNDVIALAALLGALATRFEKLEDVADCGDALAFGRLALRMRDAERASACARAALAASACDASLRDALLFASKVARRGGDGEAATAQLERALALQPGLPLRAAIHCALAKLYEHTHRDLASALRHARHSEPCEGPSAHGRRLGRLHRRLMRGVA